MDRTRNGHDTIEDTDHFCGFLLLMRSEESIRLRERMAVRVIRQTSGGVSAHASTCPEWRQRRLQKSESGRLDRKIRSGPQFTPARCSFTPKGPSRSPLTA